MKENALPLQSLWKRWYHPSQVLTNHSAALFGSYIRIMPWLIDIGNTAISLSFMPVYDKLVLI